MYDIEKSLFLLLFFQVVFCMLRFRHCRDARARVYGHTTTAVQDTECTPPPSPPHSLSSRNSTSQAVLTSNSMQLILHATRQTPHGASRSLQAKCAWSVKTRRGPSRHCTDARVHVHIVRLPPCMAFRVHPPPPPGLGLLTINEVSRGAHVPGTCDP